MHSTGGPWPLLTESTASALAPSHLREKVGMSVAAAPGTHVQLAATHDTLNASLNPSPGGEG